MVEPASFPEPINDPGRVAWGNARYFEIALEGGTECPGLGEVLEAEQSMAPERERREVHSQHDDVRAANAKLDFVQDERR
ncbi:hypothetical protein BH24CHL6_BH24CHL6_09350 [soil metagenome]